MMSPCSLGAKQHHIRARGLRSLAPLIIVFRNAAMKCKYLYYMSIYIVYKLATTKTARALRDQLAQMNSAILTS